MQREIGDAIDAEHHRFAVDDEAALADLSRRLHDPRISVGPVLAALGDQADPVAVALQPEPVGVVLDLVEPVGRSKVDKNLLARRGFSARPT